MAALTVLHVFATGSESAARRLTGGRKAVRAGLLGALALVALAAAPAPAAAQIFFEFGVWRLDPVDVIDELRDQGFRQVGPLIPRGRVYLVDATEPTGERVRLVVSAGSGDILQTIVLSQPRFIDVPPEHRRPLRRARPVEPREESGRPQRQAVVPPERPPVRPQPRPSPTLRPPAEERPQSETKPEREAPKPRTATRPEPQKPVKRETPAATPPAPVPPPAAAAPVQPPEPPRTQSARPEEPVRVIPGVTPVVPLDDAAPKTRTQPAINSVPPAALD